MQVITQSLCLEIIQKMIAIYRKYFTEGLYRFHTAASNDCMKPHDSASVMVQNKAAQGPGSVLCIPGPYPGPPPGCIKMFCVHSHHESEALRGLPGKCPFHKNAQQYFWFCLWNICMVAFLSGHDWKRRVSSQQRWAFSCFVSLAVLRHSSHTYRCAGLGCTMWRFGRCTLCNDYHDYVVSNPVTSTIITTACVENI